MKILFLDFDGVLNNFNTKERIDGFVGIDPDHVKILNRVIEETGSKVVISSSWRLQFRFDELVDYLSKQGFVGEIIGCTPDLFGAPRGDEVDEWLDEHSSVVQYAIVDDLEVFHEWQPLVRTNENLGITEKDAIKLIELLK